MGINFHQLQFTQSNVCGGWIDVGFNLELSGGGQREEDRLTIQMLVTC